MKKIYFITRTFVEPENGKSCVLLNNVYIDFLKEYFRVIVVTPSYNKSTKIGADCIKVEYNSKFVYPYMEKIGFMEDYLDPWVEKTLEVLEKIVDSEDIIFATSGGELACIKIASILKRKKNCKFVINFRDPVDYSYVGDKKTCGYFHVNRENAILKYLSNVDWVITSSDKFKEILEKKYNFLNNKIINNYYGYIEKYSKNVNHLEQLNKRMADGKSVRLLFGGSMNKPQGAELFIRLLRKKSDLEIIYIGEPNQKIRRAAKQKNITVLKPMSHDTYLSFVTENADIGLVSLAEEPYKACFPSKIFEYINLEIPILAALPEGDASRIINEKGYGRAVAYGNIEELNKALMYIMDNYEEMVTNIKRDKADWAMERNISEVINLLQKI